MEDQIKLNLLPFYVVCDESYSMQGEPIKALNDALAQLHHEVGTHPVVCDKTRFAVVGFSDTAEVIQPLADLQDLHALPELAPKGGTHFSSAFDLLKKEIEADVDQLKREGHQVFRPAVFFMTDGYATEEESKWLSALDDLTSESFRYRPNVLAFGIGDADQQAIAKVGRTKAFIVDSSMSPVQALQEFAVALTQSIIASGSGNSDMPNLKVKNPKGFTEITTEPI